MRGTVAKDTIAKCILKIFDGSFSAAGGKEIRIPFMEGSDLCQIKVTLTCAKENINAEAGSEISEAKPAFTDANREITPEEIEEVRALINKLNL